MRMDNTAMILMWERMPLWKMNSISTVLPPLTVLHLLVQMLFVRLEGVIAMLHDSVILEYFTPWKDPGG